MRTFALLSKYGPPNEDLLGASSGVVWACCAPAAGHGLVVIDVKSIVACVAMIPSTLPHPDATSPETTVYFVVDKLGVDIGHYGGMDEDEEEGEGDSEQGY